MINNINVITQKKELYDKCENMKELYDKYYSPLLEKHYKKTYILEQALDDIEKICNSIPIENSICDIGKIHDIEFIIQKTTELIKADLVVKVE